MGKRKKGYEDESESDSDGGAKLNSFLLSKADLAGGVSRHLGDDLPGSADVTMLDESKNITETSADGALFLLGHRSLLHAPDDLSQMPTDDLNESMNTTETSTEGAAFLLGHPSPLPVPDELSQMPIDNPSNDPPADPNVRCIHPGRKAEINMADCSLCEQHVDKVWQCGGCREQWCADCHKKVCYHLPKKQYRRKKECEDCGERPDTSLLCPGCQKMFCRPCYDIATEYAGRRRKTRKRQRGDVERPHEHIAHREEKKGFN